MDERPDFAEALFSFPPSDGDVFARVSEIVPAAVKGQRAQDQISVPAGFFGHSYRPYRGSFQFADAGSGGVCSRRRPALQFQRAGDLRFR